ncbi:hypothetical protein ACLM5H_11375 [Fredinandcohnia humi]
MAKKKKKKKRLGPRRKRLNQKARLENAKDWITSYTGKYIVKGYTKWYGVDLLVALKELELLGLVFSDKEKEQVMQAIKQRKDQKKRIKEKKNHRKNVILEDDSDEMFAFIAGHTSGGVPYGITHKEMDEMGRPGDETIKYKSKSILSRVTEDTRKRKSGLL